MFRTYEPLLSASSNRNNKGYRPKIGRKID